MARWLPLVSLVTILALSSCACGPPLQAEKSTPGTPTVTAPPPSTFKIGETVAIGNFRITVNKTRKSSGTEYFKPGAGHSWYIIECTLENIGKEPEPISSLLMFKLVDADGRSMGSAFGADTKGQLDGELGTGRKMTGEIAWEVPAGTKGLELIFKPSLLQKGQAIFALGNL